jgi:hypothetical protein
MLARDTDRGKGMKEWRANATHFGSEYLPKCVTEDSRDSQDDGGQILLILCQHAAGHVGWDREETEGDSCLNRIRIATSTASEFTRPVRAYCLKPFTSV